MEKNVLVVDEFGKEYGATYPRRAKGLVKHGRARFIDENTICLACPPDHDITEDSKMSDNYTNIIEQNAVNADEIITRECAEENAPELSIEYVLTQIKAIQDNDAYLYQAISELRLMDVAGPGDIGSQAKANAIAETLKSREETNRKLIDSYMKMYDKLTAEDNLKERYLDIIANAARNPAGVDFGELDAVFNTIRNM